MKPIPASMLEAIERHFHELIRSRAREGRIDCPPLQNLKLDHTTSTSKEEPEWFPVPGMYGGFAYWFDLTADCPRLVTESWCRVAEGSAQRHEITEDGINLISEGFDRVLSKEFETTSIKDSSAWRFLAAAKLEQAARRVSTLEVIGVHSDSPLGDLFQLRNRQDPNVAELLSEVSSIIRDKHVEWTIADWPFEHFWGNPYEPRHSKLIGYFIDPSQPHGCGAFLLRKLFEEMRELAEVPYEGSIAFERCHVAVESNYIDLLVTSNHPSQRFALIIENKVNGAVNQDEQLQTYVQAVHDRGYLHDEIFVWYLPRADRKLPDPADLEVIKAWGVHYSLVTFEKGILKWLNAVLSENCTAGWPREMSGGMRDNLSHYRNLIAYLTKKGKQMKLDTEIFQQLACADAKNSLPAWSDVEDLKASVLALQPCLESALRGKLIMNVQSALKQRGIESWMWRNLDSRDIVTPSSAFDECFKSCIDLCVPVTDTVTVSIGGYPHEAPGEIFWRGFIKTGNDKQQQEAISEKIVEEARRQFGSAGLGTQEPWYAWSYFKDIDYGNCADPKVATRLADLVVGMREGVARLVKN